MIDISGHLRSFRQECGFGDTDHYITVNCCGFQKFMTKNFTIHREQGRLDYQIIYITKGRGFFKLNGALLPLGEGSVVLYPPHEEQLYTYYYEDAPEVYWVHFTGYGVKDCLKKSGLLDNNSFYIGLNSTIIDTFKRIITELQVKRPMYSQISGAIFLELLSLIGRQKAEHAAGTGKLKHNHIQKVLEIIHSRYNEKWSVKDLAKECNLSLYRFIHVFKRHTGYSPLEYLTGVRMDKARELLTDSLLSVREISDIVGYDNPLYFSRLFKKATGFSPSEFRKNHEGSRK